MSLLQFGAGKSYPAVYSKVKYQVASLKTSAIRLCVSVVAVNIKIKPQLK